MISYSFLDLAHVTQNSSYTETFEKSVRSAQYAEEFGYHRYWFAEHHNMESVASTATPILIGHIAGKTNRIRVGSGGVMLPNHSPLIVAETFGTLASLYPNRIDLGLGRAPGTDTKTAQYIRSDFFQNAQNFDIRLQELQRFFSTENQHSDLRAIPAEGTNVPIWILGSSTDSAYVASRFGLPYAFASHFAPQQLVHAMAIYQQNSKEFGHKPHSMACFNVIIADTEEEAQRLSTSFYRMFLGIIRNERKPMQPPIDSMEGLWNLEEEAYVKQMTAYSFIGTKDSVKDDIKYVIKKLQLDEVIVSCPIFHIEDKLKSIRYFAEIMNE
ncbi:MAG TPA: LLM class flavin-dependent oxidoreductase [Flavobacterium sp.]|nr:LLM class flavin-dependent oxidoreductase [Flavobacterium sp.]